MTEGTRTGDGTNGDNRMHRENGLNIVVWDSSNGLMMKRADKLFISQCLIVSFFVIEQGRKN